MIAVRLPCMIAANSTHPRDAQMKTIKTSLVIFFLAITMAGCISIDHRVYSESPDPTHSQDYSGVYAATPIYASNKNELASG